MLLQLACKHYCDVIQINQILVILLLHTFAPFAIRQHTGAIPAGRVTGLI